MRAVTDPAAARNAGRRFRSPFTAGRILAGIAIGIVLYFCHIAFVPLALAMLAFLVLSGPVEMLRAWHVPRALSATLILTAFLAGVVALANFLWEPAQQWLAAAPHTLKTIEKKVRPLSQVVGRIEQLRNSAGNLGNTAKPPLAPVAPVSAPEQSVPVMLLDAMRGAALSCVTLVIVTLFLLSGGPPMVARMTAAFAGDLESAHIIGVIEQVRREVGRFYVTTLMINIGLAAATSVLMMELGMPNPLLWGTLAGILNFVPYAGATLTVLIITLVATVSFDSLGHILAVAGSYVGLATIEGQVIQPLLVGRRLRISPMLVFLGLWFGGLFWGIAGIVLATPSLVALKVIGESADNGRQLVQFLSPHLAGTDEEVEVHAEPDDTLAGSVRQRDGLPPAA